MTPTLADLQAECDAMRGYDPEWYTKMMHRIPPARVVNRVEYILDHCRGKRVLHLGCNWPAGSLHRAIAQAVAPGGLYGVDISVPEGLTDAGLFAHADLDSEMGSSALVQSLQDEQIQVIVCAEILEHLGNPGTLLRHLKGLGCPVVITVPNAFSHAGYCHVTGGVEAVNPQHVAYYSYHTLKVCVERYGYFIKDWAWYNGRPGTAEGLVMLAS